MRILSGSNGKEGGFWIKMQKNARKAKCQVLNAYARNIFSDEIKKSFEKHTQVQK